MKSIIKKYNLGNKYNKTIILLSDLHYYNKKCINNLNKILIEIKKLNPNYICISGDLTDDLIISDKDNLILWLKDLAKISKVIIALGNHEFQYKRKLTKEYDKALFKSISNIKNIMFLDNKSYSDNDINFIGLNLPYEYYNKKESSEELVSFMNNHYSKLPNKYNILLCHSPYRIANKKVLQKIASNDKINLILSGHMHAGLTFEFLKNILKGRGLLSPQFKILSKYCYGLYKYKNTNIVISSGVTKLSKSHIFGILNNLYKNEIVVINI